MSNGTALITGASSGIGLELARLFAHDGYGLVLVARDAKKLEQAAQSLQGEGPVRIIAQDLSEADGAKRLAQELLRLKIEINALVNNAGVGIMGRFDEMDLERQLHMLHLNVTALTELTWHCLGAMRRRRRGRILNVASTAAFQPGPGMAVYYASKAYVLSFSQALSEELRDSGIHVTALCPGPTRTEFGRRSGMERSRLFQTWTMDAATVARIGYQGLRQGRPVVVTGWANRLLAFSTRVVPRAWAARVVRVMQERI